MQGFHYLAGWTQPDNYLIARGGAEGAGKEGAAMEQDRPELSQPGEAVVCTMLERLQNTMETSLTSLRTELSGLARQVGSPGRAATMSQLCQQ